MTQAETKLNLLEQYMDFYIEMIFKVRDNNKYLIEKFDEWIAAQNGNYISFQKKECMYEMIDGTIRRHPMKRWNEDIERLPDGKMAIPLFVKTYMTWRYTGIEHGVSWRKIEKNTGAAFFRRKFNEGRELSCFMQKHGIQ